MNLDHFALSHICDNCPERVKARSPDYFRGTYVIGCRSRDQQYKAYCIEDPPGKSGTKLYTAIGRAVKQFPLPKLAKAS